MRIIDMHCDTLLEAWRRPELNFYDGDLSINLKLLKENDCLAQFFAMYISRSEMETMDSYEIIKSMYARYKAIMEANKAHIRPVYCVSDILKNQEEDVLSSLLTIEDGVFLDGKMERLHEVYDMGVRLVTLLWNYENSVGYPSSDTQEEHLRGLKPFGIEVVEEMNRLGMIIDTSHLSEGGFYDVAKYSKKPFVASHSCARALCGHRRNLTDDQLKTLGNAGGMVGVNFNGPFLKDDEEAPKIDWVVEHLLYMKDKAGIEAIGFGSDFDGIEDNGELVNYAGFGRLIGAMGKHFTDDEIDLICCGNALRLLKDVIGR